MTQHACGSVLTAAFSDCVPGSIRQLQERPATAPLSYVQLFFGSGPHGRKVARSGCLAPTPRALAAIARCFCSAECLQKDGKEAGIALSLMQVQRRGFHRCLWLTA